MSGSRAVRRRASARVWPIASSTPRFRRVVLGVDLVALALVVRLFAGLDAGARSWLTTGFLVLIAVAFEEGARRAARLQIRLRSQLRSDMTSVWAVTGAATLAPAQALVLVGAVFSYVWFRQQRPAGEALHRKVFTTSAALIGTAAAGLADQVVSRHDGGLPWALAGSIPIVAAIVVYTVVDRLVISMAMWVEGARGRDFVGSRHDNLIELATLCLGGLVSLAVLHEPWLVLLVIAPMVTLQRGALVRELEEAAMTDSKTGLLNAVAWEQLAGREIARGEREGKPVAVLIIDIDRFKTVNDRFGHLVGDKVLRGIGKVLTTSLREYDGLGRFGGEEFVAVLPDADAALALVIAERIRARTNEMAVSDFVDTIGRPGDDLLSVSIGVACRPTDGDELTDLLHAADQALYVAKDSGRNQVRLARRGGELPEQITA